MGGNAGEIVSYVMTLGVGILTCFGAFILFWVFHADRRGSKKPLLAFLLAAGYVLGVGACFMLEPGTYHVPRLDSVKVYFQLWTARAVAAFFLGGAVAVHLGIRAPYAAVAMVLMLFAGVFATFGVLSTASRRWAEFVLACVCYILSVIVQFAHTRRDKDKWWVLVWVLIIVSIVPYVVGLVLGSAYAREIAYTSEVWLEFVGDALAFLVLPICLVLTYGEGEVVQELRDKMRNRKNRNGKQQQQGFGANDSTPISPETRGQYGEAADAAEAGQRKDLEAAAPPSQQQQDNEDEDEGEDNNDTTTAGGGDEGNSQQQQINANLSSPYFSPAPPGAANAVRSVLKRTLPSALTSMVK